MNESSMPANVVELDTSVPVWEQFFTIAPLVLIGTRDEDGTLDLAPIFAPYVGFAIFGENYQRGEFMAGLKVAQDEVGIDRRGELPDHLEPVLRYLAATNEPFPGLVEVFAQAVSKMRKTLKEAEADNPYRHVLAAAAEAAERMEVPVGGAG